MTNNDRQLYKQAFLESLMSMGPEQVTNLIGAAKHVGFGALAHIGGNAAIKAFRGVKGNRVMQSLGELGVKHGLEGKQIHPFLMDRIKQFAGPESVAEYTGARNLVARGTTNAAQIGVEKGRLSGVLASRMGNSTLYAKGKELVDKGGKIYLGLKPTADISKYPVIGNVVSSADSFIHLNGGKLTEHKGLGGRVINGATRLLDKASVPVGTTKGLANRKVRDLANAAVATTSMAVPGLGDHVMINSIRDLATRLPVGGKAFGARIAEGMRADEPVKLFGKFGPKVIEGKGILGKARQMAGDYLYSPTAWSEAREFGMRAKKDGFTDETIKKITPLIGANMG